MARALAPETERLLRDLAPRVLGVLMRRWRDFAAAEDAVQDALAAAALQWPRDGIPANPMGWLTHVAGRRMADHVRNEAARQRREAAAAAEVRVAPPPDEVPGADDDTLTLLFMCCHEALTPASAIALTLRAVGGLSTAEIAHAFLVPEPTMAQRISRAKQSIRSSGVPFRLPSGDARAPALAAVLHVLYLIFNEGYASSSGPNLLREELSRESIRLVREVHRQLPDEAEVAGLLALMLLTDARRPARTGEGGEVIPLTEQDRSLWDRALISEGVTLLSDVFPRGEIGPYQLQAAIAAVHDEAPSAGETDWDDILGLYVMLLRLEDNPMVALSHAVATAMVHGPGAGLALLESLERDQRLQAHHRLHAVRAHLTELAGDASAAARHFETAARLATNLAERNYLLAQATRLGAA